MLQVRVWAEAPKTGMNSTKIFGKVTVRGEPVLSSRFKIKLVKASLFSQVKLS